MTAPANLPDIQATPDQRGIAIDQVGISDLRYPFRPKVRLWESAYVERNF
jgi:GTP cyclohydrolase FolE2